MARTAKAEPCCARSSAASPASFHEQYEKARTLANSGQPALALAAYNALLAQSPGNVDVLLGRGIVYTRMERWSEAQADLEAAAKASPDYADVWLALGNLHQWHDQPQQAASTRPVPTSKRRARSRRTAPKSMRPSQRWNRARRPSPVRAIPKRY